MNEARIVRADSSEHGVRLRLWIDDERGQHLAVAELLVSEGVIGRWAKEVDAEKQRADQYQLNFDN